MWCCALILSQRNCLRTDVVMSRLLISSWHKLLCPDTCSIWNKRERTLQETIYSTTEHFRHRSLKIRRKKLLVTISDSVIYWASQIKSGDVFFKIATEQHNLWRFLTVVNALRPVQPNQSPAQTQRLWRNLTSQMFATSTNRSSEVDNDDDTCTMTWLVTWMMTWLMMWVVTSLMMWRMTAHFRTRLGHFLPTIKSKLTKQVH